MQESKPILDALSALGIPYQNVQHPPVFTCEQSQQLCPPMPGKKNKNLFLRDRKGAHYYLVSLPQNIQGDLKQLATLFKVNGVSFASERRLQEVLGVSPGSVGVLALINDTNHQVELWIHEELLQEENFQSHPGINTETTIIKTEDMKRFLEKRGYSINTMKAE